MHGGFSDRHPAAWPALLVVATLAALWLGFGVSLGELIRFAGYELVLVGLPGVLCYRALSPSPGGALRHVAIGWPLGYAIGLGAFALTAALDARDLFPLIPLLAAGVAAVGVQRRGRRSEVSTAAGDPEEPPADPAPLPKAAAWSVAAIAVVALLYLGLGYFTETPLPGEVDSVAYHPDNVYQLSLVAEAKHHWPMEYPSVSGEPLRYHVYAYMHLGAVSQVTGIEPSTLLFRLFPAALLVLVALQVTALGRELGGSAWIGPLAAALVLLVGELDLDPERAGPFADSFFVALPQSPSYFFGMTLFLAGATVLLGLLSGRLKPGAGTWALLATLLLAGGGAKASILPVICGGLVLWLAWSWLRERSLPGVALRALGLGLAAFAVTYPLLYSGGSGGGFTLEPLQFMEFTVFEELVDPGSPLGDAALRVAAGPLTLLALLLPTLGIAWILREQRLRLRPEQAWLLALFVAALGLFLVLAHEGMAQAYFLNYGYLAGCVLSAQGIAGLLERSAGSWERPGRVYLAVIGGTLALGAAAAFLLYLPGGETAGLGRLALVYGLVAAGVALICILVSRGARRGAAAAAGGLALLAAISLGLLNTPLDDGAPAAERLNDGEELYTLDQSPQAPGLTRELNEGLRWVRDHSGEDDRIAVNNDTPLYLYYSALSERRALLEAWLYSIDAQEIGYRRVARGDEIPFPELRELNAAVFDAARPDAMREMRDDYGVDFLLVDKTHGTASLGVAGLGETVFENDALLVVDVRRPNGF